MGAKFSWIRWLGSTALFALIMSCAGSPAQESTSEYADDTVITAKVKTALLNDPTLSGWRLDVQTFKGTVQLKGLVRSGQDKLRADEIARSVSGVKSVRNDLIVRRPASSRSGRR